MAKLEGLFKFTGTFNGVTVVNSKTYGDHVRARRGTHKPARLNDAMKQSSQLTIAANTIAKVIKDSFEPFRQGFKDGTMWYRLVSVIRSQFKNAGDSDFSLMEGFEFHKKFKLHHILQGETNASVSSGVARTITVTVQSTLAINFKRHSADGYQQTIIGLFLDADHTPIVCSESVLFPARPLQRREQIVTWTIPPNSKTVLIAWKGICFTKGKADDRESAKGMRIVKVMNVKGG